MQTQSLDAHVSHVSFAPGDADRWASQWIAELMAADPAAGDEYALRCATGALLGVFEMRSMLSIPGEPERVSNSWVGIDAYEILFQNVVHQGLDASLDAAAHLRNIWAFVDYLGEHRVLLAGDHAQLREEFALWAGRLLHVWREGGWYDRDGTYRTQAQIDAQIDGLRGSARPQRRGVGRKSRGSKPKDESPSRKRRRR